MEQHNKTVLVRCSRQTRRDTPSGVALPELTRRALPRVPVSAG